MIMCTHKHHVFFLETTTELSHSDFLATSSPTEFLCLHISSNYDFALLTKSFVLFNHRLMAQKDLL